MTLKHGNYPSYLNFSYFLYYIHRIFTEIIDKSFYKGFVGEIGYSYIREVQKA